MSSPVCGCPGPWPGSPRRLRGWHRFSGKCEGTAPAPLRAGGTAPRATSHRRARARVRVPGRCLEAGPLPLPFTCLCLLGGVEGSWVRGADMLACSLRTSGTRWATCPWSGTPTSPTWAMTWMASASTNLCAPRTSWTSFWTRWKTLTTGEPGGGACGGGMGAGPQLMAPMGGPPGAPCRIG